MKKEEIINGLKFTVDMFLFDPSTGEEYTEPRNDMDKTTIDACRGAIELLEQEPKTGHWITESEEDNEETYTWKRELIRNEKGGCIGAKMICLKCNKDNKHDEYMAYCPNCGAKMFEP